MSFDLELYRLAETARHRLLYHASQPDHDLRCLVLHANLLDVLLLELNAENEKNGNTDRNTLPTLAAHHARLHGSTEPVIFVTETNEDAEDDEEGIELHTFQNLRSKVTSPPMLTHDTDSDSEYSDDSDPEHEDSDGFEVNSIPESPTTSISDDENARFAADEKDDGLSLHRTTSHWKLQKRGH
jgi:hypothetical protein